MQINRIKGAYEQNRNKRHVTRIKNVPQEKCTSPVDKPELDAAIPSGIRLFESEDDSLSETEEVITDKPSQGYAHDSDWAPRSLYLQRKLQSDKTTDGIAYRLRSRRVSMSEPEPESGNAQSSASPD